MTFVNMLGKLKLEVENTGPVMEGHAPSKMTYCGISAIDIVAKLKQQHLTLSYDKEILADIIFEEGCGRLTKDALGLKKAAEASEELQAVLECAIKMKGGADSPDIRALLNDEPVELSGFEERKNKVLADKPNSHALNKDLYRYYEKATWQDFMADTKEKVMAGMVKLMEDAGLRAVKIANIARTNPDFKPELLPERNSKLTFDT